MEHPIRSELEKLPKEKLIELIFMYSRNWLTCDGLYFTATEEKYGIDAALEIDIHMWKIGSRIEAKRIKEVLGISEGGLDNVLRTITFMSWSPSSEYEIERKGNQALLTCVHCPPQEARVRKGLGEFACRPTFENGFRNVIEVIDPRVKVECKICPPGPHPPDIWCQWEFELDE